MSKIQEILERSVEWIEAQGDAAPFLYTIFLALWITCLLPSSAVEIIPGFLFGQTKGFAVALAGKLLGTAISVFLARRCFKSYAIKLVQSSPRLVAICQAIEEDGLPIMVVVRLSYIPLVVKNYGLAVLDISWSTILAAAFLAGTPFAFLWSFIGASSRDLASILAGEKSPKDFLPEDPRHVVALLSLGLIVLVAALGVLRRVKRKVDARIAEIAESDKGSNSNDKRSWWPIAMTIVVCGGAAVYWANREQIPALKDIMLGAVSWIRNQGAMGPLYYAAFLAVWVAALLPCSILEMVPGYLFGFKVGVVVSIVGKNIGTVMSLLIGRYLLRDMMQEKLLKRYPKLVALEKAVKLEGFPVLVMIRCAYLPMLVKNYGLSCLDINIFQVWCASLFAAFPFAAFWTFLGASATNLADIFEGKMKPSDVFPENALFLAVPGSLLVLVFGYFFMSFMRRFREILAQVETDEPKQKAE